MTGQSFADTVLEQRDDVARHGSAESGIRDEIAEYRREIEETGGNSRRIVARGRDDAGEHRGHRIGHGNCAACLIGAARIPDPARGRQCEVAK